VRIAWFAPEPDDVSAELGRSLHVDHVNQQRAHDFVWQQFTAPYDLTLFELGDTAAHTFVWPYLFHYPGVVILRAPSLQHSRGHALRLHQRYQDLRAERAFSGFNFLRAPLAASRLVVVHDPLVAHELQIAFPTLCVRVVPIGAAASEVQPSDGHCRFHVVGARRDVVDRAAARARNAGVAVTVVAGMDHVTPDDVVIALEWPPSAAPPIDGVRAMAAALPTVVLETEAVAAWPTLDPQTWQCRGYSGDAAPVAVSIDPRDEEHSLMLAMRRLGVDARLRTSLGRAAAAWAHAFARLDTAAAAWRPVLEEATHCTPLADRTTLPAHLVEDGTATARTLLAEIGVAVDFIESSMVNRDQ
jgi:hypothetical protein